MGNRIKKEDFKEIGIKARVAYGICCLENALVFYNKDITQWQNLLNFLWEFPPKTDMYNEWTEKLLSYIPDIGLEYALEYIKEEEYHYYKKLYSVTEKLILEIIVLLFDIGMEELYVGIQKHSPDTLEHIQKILDLMYENEIPLPKITPFRQFKFDVSPTRDYGWGFPFNGKKILSRFR